MLTRLEDQTLFLVSSSPADDVLQISVHQSNVPIVAKAQALIKSTPLPCEAFCVRMASQKVKRTCKDGGDPGISPGRKLISAAQGCGGRHLVPDIVGVKQLFARSLGPSNAMSDHSHPQNDQTDRHERDICAGQRSTSFRINPVQPRRRVVDDSFAM